MAELTTAPEGYNTKFMTGLCQLIDTEGLAVYADSGVYDSEDWGLFLGLTPDQPDRAITLMSYPVEDTDLTDTITGIQFRIRGRRDPTEVENMADALYDLLHNRSHYYVNGVHVELSWRQSGAWMGQDTNQRIERVENFYARTQRESTHKIQ